MENKKAIELIKLSTIGCVSQSDLSDLAVLMAEDENFPWKELGEFQNLAALIPASLVLETPGWEIKDMVARKLYDLRDKIITRVKEPEPVEETAKPVEQLLEEPLVEFETQEDVVNMQTSHPLQSVLKEQPEREVVFEDKIDKRELKSKTPIDKELIEKITRDYIKSYFKDEMEVLQKSIKNSRLVSIVLFIIVLLMMILLYFKFSGDVGSNQEEINKIKNRIGISLLKMQAEKNSSFA